MARGGSPMDGAPAWALALDARVRDLTREVRALLRQHEPKPVWWPDRDCLLDRHDAARIVGVHVTNWSRYWKLSPALVAGYRTVQSRGPGSDGTGRWLLSACLQHNHVERLDRLEDMPDAAGQDGVAA